MSNPFAKTFEELRSPFLHEKMAKKDYDGDGKIETGTQEYMGSRDKAIKKAMGKDPKKEMKKEHHQKDADGKVIEHEDTAPASLDELSNRTMRNYIIKGTSDVAKRASDPDSDEGPKYKKLRSRMDGVMSAGDKLARRADKADKKEKKKEKKEEISYTAVYLQKKNVDEAKIDKGMSDAQKRERRNKAAGMKDKPFRSLSKDQVSKQNQEFRRDYHHSEKRGVKKEKGKMTLKDRVGNMRGMSRANRLKNIVSC